jgi:hypothetical protein
MKRSPEINLQSNETAKSFDRLADTNTPISPRTGKPPSRNGAESINRRANAMVVSQTARMTPESVCKTFPKECKCIRSRVQVSWQEK